MQRHVFLLAGQFPGRTHAQTLAAALRYGVAAERHGYAGVWMAEHHFISYGVCPSAVAFAANLLGRTRRITVGTAAAILSNRHPVALAEEAVLLDELSGGRFALGVARGGPWVDLEVFRTGLPRYRHGLAESLDLLLRWLSGASPVGARGETFAFREVAVVPRPNRPIGVWLAATSPATADLAAARGLPLLLGMHATDAEHAAVLDRYADVTARHGHDPATAAHASAHLVYVHPDDRGAVDAARAPLAALLAGTTDYVRLGAAAPPRDLDAYRDHLLRIGAVGSPATCRQILAASAAATGVRHQLLMLEGGGTEEHTLTAIAQLSAGAPEAEAAP